MNKIFLLGLFLFSNIAICSAQTKAVRFETKEAGTLASLFKHSGVDFSDVRTLVVAGPLNGDDIIAIREACGVSNKTYNDTYHNEIYYHPTTGKVSNIDMSDSYVLSGGKSYAQDIHGTYPYTFSAYDEFYTRDNVSSSLFFYDAHVERVWFSLIDDVEYGGWYNIGPKIKTIEPSSFAPYFSARCFSEDVIKYLGYETKPTDIKVYISVPEYMLELYRADTDNNPAFTKKVSGFTIDDFKLVDFVSSNHEDNSVSEYRYPIYIPQGSTLSFDYSVNSEEGSDFLNITLNGTPLVKNKSGKKSGSYTNTFTSDVDGELVVTYTKDESVSEGKDVASVKNIKISHGIRKGADGFHLCLDVDKYIFHDKVPVCINDKLLIHNFEYKRNFPNTKWQALYVPFGMSYSDWADEFEIARINDVNMYDMDDDGVIDDTEIEIVKIKNGKLLPNHPYMIRAKSAGEKTIRLETAKIEPTDNYMISCSSADTKFTFVGTYDGVSGTNMMDNHWLALSDGTLKSATSDKASLSACRWYLEVNSFGSQVLPETINNVRVRVLGEGDVVGINDADTEKASTEETYTIDGRKLNNQIKGINIIKLSNGEVRKVWKK